MSARLVDGPVLYIIQITVSRKGSITDSTLLVQNKISGQVSKNTLIITWLLGLRKYIMSNKNMRAVRSSPKKLNILRYFDNHNINASLHYRL